MMRTTTRTVRNLIAVGGVAALLAGCNSEDGATSATSRSAQVTPSTTSSAVTPTATAQSSGSTQPVSATPTGSGPASTTSTTSTATSTATTSAPSTRSAGGASTSASAAQQQSRPSTTKVTQQLWTVSGARQLSVVQLRRTGASPGGIAYRGATLGTGDTVTFWRYVNTRGAWTWKKDTTLPFVSPLPNSRRPTVTGGLVKGSPDPVFVVNGFFTGNSSGKAIAYHRNDRDGWGVLVAQPDKSLRSSGKGMRSLDEKGLELDITVEDGLLITSSLWGEDSDAYMVEQTSNPVIRTWYGDGRGGFDLQGETGGNSGGSS